MASILSRLIGALQPVPEPAKDVSGPGVWSMMNYAPVAGSSADPHKLMAEGQLLFHRHAWVAAAERAIYGRYVRASWHLETGDGDTIDPRTAQGPVLVAHELIEHPSKNRSRRALWGLTLRHMGLCGIAHWLLDQRDVLNGIPLQTLYINPARMTAVGDELGELQGWILDDPRNPVVKWTTGAPRGVPIELEEIRTFRLDEPDAGHYGIGIAETAYNEVMLEKAATDHMADVLATGGRKPGIYMPKTTTGGTVTMNDDQWQALIRDFRNISANPEAARRQIITKGPVDFMDTALTPQELQLNELMKMGREDTLASWGVPLSQIGIMQSSGLNSGEHVKYEEAALWQGAIEFRASAFEETVQSILDLFKPLTGDLSLVVETPTFDDQKPLFENAQLARLLPLTNGERRAMVGLDPFEDDDLNLQVFLDKSMVLITAPEREEQNHPQPEDEEELGTQSAVMKARLRQREVADLKPKVADLLRRMARSIRRRVEGRHEHLMGAPADDQTWWDEGRWFREFSDTLRPALAGTVATTARSRSKQFKQGKADTFLDRVAEYVRLKGADRIRGMLNVTRSDIQRVILDGIRDGLSPAELGDRIEAATAFDENRSETIARTESMLAMNDATIGTYREFQVERVQAIDGDTDAECAARNGAIFTLDEASGISDHPNGTLDWVPVEAGKALPVPVSVYNAEEPELKASELQAILAAWSKAQPSGSPVTIHLPDHLSIPAPQVSVSVLPATVNVPEQKAPQVNITPELKVEIPEAKASTLPAEVKIVGMPQRSKRAVRNKKGEIEGSIEGDL